MKLLIVSLALLDIILGNEELDLIPIKLTINLEWELSITKLYE